MKDKEARDDIHAQKLNLEFADRRLRDLRAEHNQLKDDFLLLLQHLNLQRVTQVTHKTESMGYDDTNTFYRNTNIGGPIGQ